MQGDEGMVGEFEVGGKNRRVFLLMLEKMTADEGKLFNSARRS